MRIGARIYIVLSVCLTTVILPAIVKAASSQAAVDADVARRSVMAGSKAKALMARSQWDAGKATRVRTASVHATASIARLTDRSIGQRRPAGIPAAGFLKRLNDRSEYTESRMRGIQKRGEPRPPRLTDTGAAFQKRVQRRSDPGTWGGLTHSMKSSTMSDADLQRLQSRSVYGPSQYKRIYRKSVDRGGR